eukprot:CAMPEP_0185748944 /NCGR_PEP_ID=MMETSP1174-20130828/7680_1 /TAXON_ID=35687 /ORGANISM="Dictyocha speculum, Strain CCMP1381" /LENGTH=164 /DNA_ID=CAMNT_0028424859 /DNA_START=417 /DNA_END=912 /DNA_ORIENTATION=+
MMMVLFRCSALCLSSAHTSTSWAAPYRSLVFHDKKPSRSLTNRRPEEVAAAYDQDVAWSRWEMLRSLGMSNSVRPEGSWKNSRHASDVYGTSPQLLRCWEWRDGVWWWCGGGSGLMRPPLGGEWPEPHGDGEVLLGSPTPPAEISSTRRAGSQTGPERRAGESE